MAQIVSLTGEASQSGPLKTQLDGKVLTITLANPPAHALSLEMIGLLHGALLDARDNPKVAVIVIASSGKVFCAGHDLKQMRGYREGADGGARALETLFAACSEMMKAIPRLPKTVIAKVDGIATAAGCQLVAACDLAFASEDAQFGTPGVSIGGFCATPMVALSRNLSRKHAMEMLLTGDMVDAKTAMRMGLVNKIVPRDYLDQVVAKMAERIASKSAMAIARGKRAFYEQADMRLSEAYDYANRVMVESFTTADSDEGLDAFIGKRKPEWKGE
ncbi:enoyl-CoA hydratase [Salaquimonas pukyongi]|uniref:enoyl-CoA hydratase n=1 Tax=Salaquimonas pukyongi TaxID=2712698 RepID=UPI00096B7D35|nr:enoyl-CoA hydratase [Salaquimonas pukyongi]